MSLEWDTSSDIARNVPKDYCVEAGGCNQEWAASSCSCMKIKGYLGIGSGPNAGPETPSTPNTLDCIVGGPDCPPVSPGLFATCVN